MALHEYVGNLHIHTPYSDGTEYHETVAQAAGAAGLDFVVVTDHNMLVQGVEGYYGDDQRGYVLLMTGQEVHDRTRQPQTNHLLVYNTGREMSGYAANPQKLIEAVHQARGLSFLAHPFDTGIPWLPASGNGMAIPWVNWEVKGYTGLEIWNYMADFKEALPTVGEGLRALFAPENAVVSPRPQTLQQWDKLLSEGRRVVGIGGADAHGGYVRLGFYKHRVYPYDFLFSCINTHLLTSRPMTGELAHDRALLFDALREGRAFIGYDIPGNTRGFRFTAHGEDGQAEMGDTARLRGGVTLQTLAPDRGSIRMICNGKVVAQNDDYSEALTYIAREPGAYRVEVWREYQGVLRCWILSNPIYVAL